MHTHSVGLKVTIQVIHCIEYYLVTSRTVIEVAVEPKTKNDQDKMGQVFPSKISLPKLCQHSKYRQINTSKLNWFQTVIAGYQVGELVMH